MSGKDGWKGGIIDLTSINSLKLGGLEVTVTRKADNGSTAEICAYNNGNNPIEFKVHGSEESFDDAPTHLCKSEGQCLLELTLDHQARLGWRHT